MDKNTKNIALIELGKLKFNGQKTKGLLLATINAWKKADISGGEDNVAQIGFAKTVWNNLGQANRIGLLPTNNDEFLKLAANADMTDVISATLNAFTSSIKTGSSTGKEAYEDIVRNYNEAKLIQQNEAPFAPQLTPAQERLIARFESNVRDKPDYETHYPNENAVTYVYLLALAMTEMKLNKAENSKIILEIMQDVLKFVEMHGSKTTAHFHRVVDKYENIVGPTSKIELKTHIQSLISSDNFVTGTGPSDDNKYLANNKLSMKRMYRMTHIFTNANTPWAILQQKGSDFVTNINALYQAEVAVDSPDMISLSIVWYLCIGRQNMSCVMVDHHELSASNVLMTLLKMDANNAFPKPSHAFDFAHDIGLDM